LPRPVLGPDVGHLDVEEGLDGLLDLVLVAIGLTSNV
jgi:hypothetical protein